VLSRKWITAMVAAATLCAASQGFSNQTFAVSNNSLTSYRIDGATNPTLSLIRGQTYTFNINASGHPFWIKTVNSIGTANAYNSGVTGNGTDVGTLTFVVPLNAPASLHYNCEFHSSMNGAITVSDPVPVETDTWGKLKHRYLR
jgi:plastocyanin